MKIVGHDWADIQRAQLGGQLHRKVDLSKPAKPAASEADRALLAQYGTVEALEAAGLFGVADRLR